MSQIDLNIKETLVQIDLLLHNATKRRFVHVADCDDLRQDVFIAVFTGIKCYDARRSSWPTFLAMIIQSEIHRFRLKRRWMKHRACESIHDLEEEDHPLTNYYPTSELNDVERNAFLGEVHQAMTELPDDLQTICRVLLTSSKAKAADTLGLEAKTLSEKIACIRQRLFESKIIQDYLKKEF